MDSDAKAYQELRFELIRLATALVGPSEAEDVVATWDEGSGAAGWPCKVEGPSELRGYARFNETGRWSPDLGPMESMFAVENKANEEETSCTHG